MLYRHKKTGNLYRHLAVAVEKSQGRDGMPYVVYCPDDDEHTIYIREQSEMEIHFDIARTPSPNV